MNQAKLSINGLQNRIAELRAAFVGRLPARLEAVKDLLAELADDQRNQKASAGLHLQLHSLKGTASSFGFLEMGGLAARGERLAQQLQEAQGDTSHHAQEEIAQCIASIRACFGAMVAAVPPTDAVPTGLADPAAPGAALETVAAPAPGEGACSDRNLVYLCDDDQVQTELLGTQLRCFGFHVEIFHSTDSFRSAVHARMPALAVLDIMFPGNPDGGTSALAALRAEGIMFPVVFCTSRTDFGARLAAIRAGGEAYFPKPASVMDLVAALDLLDGGTAPAPFKVLVVDDEMDTGNYHSAILEAAGMTTRVTNQPELVLDLVSEFRPDLVLMDMYMPSCTGREVAKLIRQIPDCVSLPIIFLSSETDKDKQLSALRSGAEAFLTKPIPPTELVAAVTLRAERMRTLQSLMARDSLTGLYNHTTTTQLLENAVASARRQNQSLCFAMIDLDKFKSVNDTYGHPVGDQVILGLARVLRQRLRNTDLVGRYGGEEFAVVLPNVEGGKAWEIMEQLRQDFSQVRFHAGATEFSCTFSCGVAAFPGLQSMETLREAADGALYKAKHGGRNQVVVWEP